MFDKLSDKLQVALGDLRGRGVLRDLFFPRAMRKIPWRCSIPTSIKDVKEFVAKLASSGAPSI
jgi:hypothetical protein